MAEKLRIWYTSDLHGNLFPTDFISEQPLDRGLLSMQCPKDENTLLIDGGDILHGTPMTAYFGGRGEQSPTAEVMNAMGYDYVVPGNHDFSFGKAYLAEYLGSLDAKCLCANLEDPEGLLPLQPYDLKVMPGGLKVGLFGLCTDWTPRWETPEHLGGVRFTPPLAAAEKAVSALKALGAEVIVGVYHGGPESDPETGRVYSAGDENIACRLCEALPVDLLLTGHQHMAIPSMLCRGTRLVQPGSDGQYYALATLGEDGRFATELLRPRARTDWPASCRAAWERVQTWLDRPAGRLDRDLIPDARARMAAEGSFIADLFNRVQLEASGADVSCAALFNDVPAFRRDLTVREVVAAYPYPNTLVVREITGKVLRAALEKSASYFAVSPDGRVSVAREYLDPRPAHFQYDYFMGLDYTFDLTRAPGDRVARMERNGRPVAPEDRLTLCMNSFRSTGTGGFDFYLPCPVIKEILADMGELLLDYLRRHDTVAFPDTHPVTCILPETKGEPYE